MRKTYFSIIALSALLFSGCAATNTQLTADTKFFDLDFVSINVTNNTNSGNGNTSYGFQKPNIN